MRRIAGFPYPYHLHFAMSKHVTRSVGDEGLSRWLGWAVVLATIGCRPEAVNPQRECQTDAECGEARRCQAGRCEPEAGSGTRAAATATAQTAPPQAAPPAEGPPPAPRGPIEAPKEQWAVELGAVVYARPTLVPRDDEVVAYVGSHAGRFVGVVVDGPRAGTTVLDLWVDGIIWSTAAADARGWLYFGADDDHLYAVDPEAGAIAWRRRLGKCEPTRSPGPEGVRCDVDGGPTLGGDGDLYVGADGLYRIGTDGEIRWHYPPPDADRGSHVATTPLWTDDLVVYGNYARRLMALDHDGVLQWELPLSADVDGSPVRGRDGTIYAGSDDGSLHAVGPDGTPRWSFDAGSEVRSAPAIGADGTLVFGTHGGKLFAVEPDGTMRWVLPTEGAIHASPLIDAEGRIFVGSRDERLYALDLQGHVYWNLEMPDQIDSGAVLSPGGTLVVGCDDGVLRGLR